MPRTGAGALALALLLSGCGGDSVQVQEDSSPGFACTANIQPGIEVMVLDDATGAQAWCGARVVLTSGSYSESVELSDPGIGCQTGFIVGGAWERPGTYTVTVSKPGYRDFVQNDVVVTRGVCHVSTTRITARLVPF